MRVSYLLFAFSSLFLWCLLYVMGTSVRIPPRQVSAPIKNLCSKILGILKDTQKASK